MKKIILYSIFFLVSTIMFGFIIKSDANCTYLIAKTISGNIIAFPKDCVDKSKSIYVLFTKEENRTFKNCSLENCTVTFKKNEVNFIASNNKKITFKIDAKQEPTLYNGYGLLKVEDAAYVEYLNSSLSTSIDIALIDIYIAYCNPNNTPPPQSCSCSGGLGATECACSAGIATASWGTSVSCGAGYFACCPTKMKVNEGFIDTEFFKLEDK